MLGFRDVCVPVSHSHRIPPVHSHEMQNRITPRLVDESKNEKTPKPLWFRGFQWCPIGDSNPGHPD